MFDWSEVLKWIGEHISTIWWIVGSCLVVILGWISVPRRVTFYKQPKTEGYADFRDVRAKTYINNSPVGSPGEGKCTTLKDGIIEISRSNTEGRLVLQFQNFRMSDGQTSSYIPARPEAGGSRYFDVNFEARAFDGPHRLRMAFRSYPKEDFIKDAYVSVESGQWQKFGRLLVPRADRDMYFFL